jgi:hypothetical protein
LTDENNDPWPFIVAEMDAAWREAGAMLQSSPRGFLHAAEARYKKGQEEYAGTTGDWMNWPMDRFENEAMQELIDLVLYIAMRRVKFGTGMA